MTAQIKGINGPVLDNMTANFFKYMKNHHEEEYIYILCIDKRRVKLISLEDRGKKIFVQILCVSVKS